MQALVLGPSTLPRNSHWGPFPNAQGSPKVSPDSLPEAGRPQAFHNNGSLGMLCEVAKHAISDVVVEGCTRCGCLAVLLAVSHCRTAHAGLTRTCLNQRPAHAVSIQQHLNLRTYVQLEYNASTLFQDNRCRGTFAPLAEEPWPSRLSRDRSTIASTRLSSASAGRGASWLPTRAS